MAMTAEQETEYARLSADRKAGIYPDKDEVERLTPAQLKAKFERFTPVQLKAKVNILGIGATVKWATECNYTDAEKEYIEAAMPRSKWATAVPHSDQVDP